MTATLVVFGLLLAVLAWIFFAGRGAGHEPTAHRRAREDIDQSELEAAERDVQDAESEDAVRDWGPGAGKPRPPELL
jgi:hypothetical protein